MITRRALSRSRLFSDPRPRPHGIIRDAMLRRVLFTAIEGEDGGSFPAEFRLFAFGVNDSSKGPVIFDEHAAALVMSAYQKQGVRLMLDLEHLSLDPGLFDTDARAWFDLEVRAGDGLYAVNVNWTPDGQRRLRDRTQVYISPAFTVDEESRVTSLINAALTSMPATFNAQQLIAASRLVKLNEGTNMSMSPELAAEAVTIIESGDGAQALELLKKLITEQLGGETEEEPGSSESEGEAPAASDETAAELSSITGETDVKKALSVLKSWKRVIDETASASKTVELNERKSLVGKLVQLGAETPATAYEEDGSRLTERLSKEPLASLKARVAALSALKRPAARPPVKTVAAPSAKDIAGAKALSVKLSARAGTTVVVTPEEFAARRNQAVRK